MAKVKVTVDYSTNRYSDLELKSKGDNVVICLTDNPKFVTLVAIVALIKAQLIEFGNLLALMPQGNKQVTLDKNKSRAILENLLGSTALQVQDLSGGDEGTIIGAGFDVKRKPAPIGLLERPTKLEAKEGPIRGSLEVSWNVVPNAYIYELQYTEAPSTDDSKWIRISSTKRKLIIDGLIRGKAYAIKVAAAGTDPGRVWSDEIISYVM